MKKNNVLFVLIFILSMSLSAQENFNKQIDDIVEKNYFISSYFDVLKTQNRDSIRKLGDIFNDITYEEPEGWVTRKWYDESVFSFDKLELVYDLSETRFDNLFSIGSTTLTVLDFKKYDSYSVLTLQHGSPYNYEFDGCTLLNWGQVRKQESTNITYEGRGGITWKEYSNDFIFEEDGDYLLVYFDKEKKIPFATFASMNDETEVQFKNLIYYNTCDFSRVTWPRHADGTCDYDDEIKPPKVQLSDNDSVSEEEEETATPSDTLSENEEDIETVLSAKKSSSLPFVIIVASAVIMLLFIVIVLIVRKKKKQ